MRAGPALLAERAHIHQHPRPPESFFGEIPFFRQKELRLLYPGGTGRWKRPHRYSATPASQARRSGVKLVGALDDFSEPRMALIACIDGVLDMVGTRRLELLTSTVSR